MLKFYAKKNAHDSEYIELVDGNLKLENPYSCVWEIVILKSKTNDEDKDYITSNNFSIPINDSYWIEARRNFNDVTNDVVYNSLDELNENNPEPTMILYIGDNTTKYEQYQYYTVTSNTAGDFSILTIIQPECKFDIISENDEDIVLDSGIEKTLKVTVYGGSKNIDIFITAYSYEDDDIVDIDDIRFSYKLIEKHERFNVYEITVMYYGSIYDYDDDNPYYYTMNIVHRDNVSSVKEVIMRPVFISRPDVYEINSLFDNVWNQQIGICTTRNDRNKKNLADTKCDFNMGSMTRNLAARIKQRIDVFDDKNFTPLTVLSVEGNVIRIKSCNALGENNSALVIKAMSSWCFYETLFSEDDEHIITINCEKNIYGGKRRCSLTIKNAETNFGILQFMVTQDEKSNIHIKSIKSNS